MDLVVKPLLSLLGFIVGGLYLLVKAMFGKSEGDTPYSMKGGIQSAAESIKSVSQAFDDLEKDLEEKEAKSKDEESKPKPSDDGVDPLARFEKIINDGNKKLSKKMDKNHKDVNKRIDDSHDAASEVLKGLQDEIEEIKKSKTEGFGSK